MRRLGIAGGDYVEGLEVGAALLIPRHGDDPYVQPHRIDHEANMRRLLEAGCDRVLALGSVGGLRRELDVGTFLCPDDFIALHVGRSAFDDRRSHLVPGFDTGWRELILQAWSDEAAELRDGGTYWETIGPRFETPAEIRLIAQHADVVGMTIASESVIARELGLRYAAICVVDNLANGVGERELTVEEFRAGRAANRERLAAAVATLVPALSEEEP